LQNAKFKDLTPIMQRYRIAALYIFGSRSGEAAALLAGGKEPDGQGKSDIDVGVLPLRGVRLTPKEKVRLTLALEDLFQARRIDLVALPETDPFLAANIIRGERLYCANDDEIDEYELYVLRRAGDLIPLEEERIRLILGQSQ